MSCEAYLFILDNWITPQRQPENGLSVFRLPFAHALNRFKL